MSTRFSAAELKSKLSQAFDKSFFGPVVISRHGRDSFVLLHAEEFNRMREAAQKSGYVIRDEDESVAA